MNLNVNNEKSNSRGDLRSRFGGDGVPRRARIKLKRYKLQFERSLTKLVKTKEQGLVVLLFCLA